MAAAASLITCAAGDRPVIEMGSRRVDPSAAAWRRPAPPYLAGFTTTSNLEAGRIYGIPTAGTASHAFVLAYPSEKEAFAAQVAAFGPGTTLLVDTYDVEQGIRNAVEVAGPDLGAVRIDSGDLGREAARARALLDQLGARRTRLVVTGDLDAHTIAALGAAPVDSYGVGANVVTGMGVPTAGFVYKLVAIGDPGAGPDEPQSPVAKRSPGKASFGGENGRGGRCSTMRRAGARWAPPPQRGRFGPTLSPVPRTAHRRRHVPCKRRSSRPAERWANQTSQRYEHSTPMLRDAVGPSRPLLLDRRTK